MQKNVITIFILAIIAVNCLTCSSNHDKRYSATQNWPELKFDKTVSGLDQPTHIADAGDNSGRLFVIERRGRIRIVKNGELISTPFLDISDRVLSNGSEQGLLSIAFPKNYSGDGHFYLNYTARLGDGDTIVARYRVSSNPDIAEPASEQILLTVDQPFSNHNGGQISFGHDGYLYIGMGDGGSRGDPLNNGQNPNSLLGKILRIDVESNPTTNEYNIPSDNPFHHKKDYRPEIWATGLRNPWRFSFDRMTGDLFIADVGQNSYEEIDYQPVSSPGGENYGWNVMEGTHCFKSISCKREGLSLPVIEYEHSNGNCSVTGGMIYRGEEYSSMKGIYLYGDFCSGTIWGLRKTEIGWGNSILSVTPYQISTFGEDITGNIYLADYKKGDIYKITSK